ncbi:specifically androgen-regulated gene protein [Indicator indicator]|uniref:specifically androgen-regulated gene protein n=1 Tax=Indicator indicator TaxID=1002788 RepID=UPI0023DFA2DE|nr:specifically androgen-regulated gene protein [Indicator indicator]
MPKKELGMAGCNSGSCDSMVSTASNHSQRSDNSYDYLSVEEKECLMFLEETIGSLDAEADSGVSTDETDYVEPSELPGMWHRRDSSAQDVENGSPLPHVGHQQAAQHRSSKNISAFSSSAPAAVASPGYHSLPRSITVANGAPDSQATVCTVEDPVPGDKPSQMAKEDRLDPANTRSQRKSLGTLIIQPPDPFQDDLGSQEWSRTSRSDAKRERAKEPKAWTAWGQTDKPTSEEAPQDQDAKRGPPTAPKPRKLPPNIILKTSKNSSVPLPTEASQKVKATPPSLASSQPSDSAAEKLNLGHLDPKDREKAHREALEKLGLSQDRREPSTRLQPGNNHPQPTTHPQARETPSPGPGEPEAGCGAAERLVPGVRQMTFKSNTLERSGVGLSSYMASSKEQNVKASSSLGKMSFIERLAPSFLRSNRPRPVSLGAGKDFAGLKESGQVEQEKSSKRRSHPLQNFPKPPRSCVSVKISPKGTADENRREALKKLGLLKE